MASLTLRSIRKNLGGNEILRGIDLDVADGELVVLVGPSGCGKSTLLRTVAGLELPDGGSLHIGDRDVTELAPRERDVAMVFQSYALYPHLSVRDNLAFGLKLRKTDAATVERRVAEVAKMLGLEPLLGRYPRQLSGGQRQRVAMGRAVARRPSLFLFDEPLSNLDAALRAEVRVEIKKLHGQLDATMLYVTHDQVEAMTLADRLVVLNEGAVEQIGPPLEVYERPASRFVASFMGSPAMNFVSATVERGRVRAEGIDLPVADGALEGEVLAGIRPHDVVLSGPGEGRGQGQGQGQGHGGGHIELCVDVLEPMGFEAYAHGHVGSAPFVARLEGADIERATPGASLRFTLPPARLHLFHPQTHQRTA